MLILAIILILIPFALGIWAAFELNEEVLILAGLMISVIVGAMILAFSEKPTGNYSPPIKSYLVEKGDFSASLYLKDDSGNIEQTLRITDAAQLDAFKKGEFEIKKEEMTNWFCKSYYESAKFYILRPEKD